MCNALVVADLRRKMLAAEELKKQEEHYIKTDSIIEDISIYTGE